MPPLQSQSLDPLGTTLQSGLQYSATGPLLLLSVVIADALLAQAAVAVAVAVAVVAVTEDDVGDDVNDDGGHVAGGDLVGIPWFSQQCWQWFLSIPVL